MDISFDLIRSSLLSVVWDIAPRATPVERVKETHVLVKSVQLCHLLLRKLKVEETDVLTESLDLGSLD